MLLLTRTVEDTRDVILRSEGITSLATIITSDDVEVRGRARRALAKLAQLGALFTVVCFVS